MAERFAREVKRDSGAPVVNAHVDDSLGRRGIDVGTRAGFVAKAIDHGVLNAKHGETGVAQLGVGTVSSNRHASGRIDGVFPVDIINARIKKIGVARVDASEHQCDARSQARPQARTVRMGLIAEERYAAGKGANTLDAKRAELVGKKRFEPRDATGEELELVHH